MIGMRRDSTRFLGLLTIALSMATLAAVPGALASSSSAPQTPFQCRKAFGPGTAARANCIKNLPGSSCAKPNVSQWTDGGMIVTSDRHDIKITGSRAFVAAQNQSQVVYHWNTRHPGVVICRVTLRYYAPHAESMVAFLTVPLPTGKTSGQASFSYGRSDPRYLASSWLTVESRTTG
jgi:hypothetical protein